MPAKKKATREEEGREEEDAYDEDEKSPKKKKVKAEGEKGPSPMFEIGKSRKVNVNVFKGTTLVNIREYYTDKATGEEKPGSKGISLTVDQWNAVKGHITAIDAAVAAIDSN